MTAVSGRPKPEICPLPGRFWVNTLAQGVHSCPRHIFLIQGLDLLYVVIYFLSDMAYL